MKNLSQAESEASDKQKQLSEILLNGQNYCKSEQQIKDLLKEKIEGLQAGKSIRNMIKNNPTEVLTMFLNYSKRLAVYFPESADYFTAAPFDTSSQKMVYKSSFIGELINSIIQVHPDLLLPEIEYAIHSRLPAYKYHTSPKIQDIVAFVKDYHDRQRMDWIDEALHNKDQELNKPYANDVAEILKKSLADAQEYWDGVAKEAEKQRQEQIAINAERVRRRMASDIERGEIQKAFVMFSDEENDTES
jgi:hypothetical protein